MSGGSYDYAYFKALEFSSLLRENNEEHDMPTHVRITREKFAEHLELVAKAMRDIEWVDSGDKSPGGEVDAINAVFENKYT